MGVGERERDRDGQQSANNDDANNAMLAFVSVCIAFQPATKFTKWRAERERKREREKYYPLLA